MTASISIDTWWAQGERVPVELGGAARSIFLWRGGEGPSMTLLHGFPSSSYDWAKVAPALARRHTLLALDFLGFGASEKPAEHDYSLSEQADLVEAAWARDGVTATVLVAHDYAVSVAQELLLDPEHGPNVGELISEELFVARSRLRRAHGRAGRRAPAARAAARDGRRRALAAARSARARRRCAAR